MEKQGEKRRRLVLVTLPSPGNVNPMFQLGTILQSKGFSIAIALPQYKRPIPSTGHDFTILSLSDGLSGLDLSSMSFRDIISILNSNFEVSLREYLTRVIQEQDCDEKLPCIIYGSLMYCGEAVAQQLNLPCFILRPNSAANMLVYHAFPKEQFPFEDSKLSDVATGLGPLRYKDLPSFPFDSDPTSYLLWLLEVTGNVGSTSALIYNTVSFLEEEPLAKIHELCNVPYFAIGPMHKIASAPSGSYLEEETSCITWLDKHAPKSVLYVSLGSVTSLTEKELVEMACGLAYSKQPFLWVIRPDMIRGKNAMELLPDGFKEDVAERGYIAKWAPQKAVLAHAAVGGFLTHCGWNSTLESISEGVPMICRPFFGDQFVQTRYVICVWKLGLELDKEMDRQDIERVIRRLMVGKEGEEIRQRAKDLKQKVELSVQVGGSTYNSVNDLVEFISSC